MKRANVHPNAVIDVGVPANRLLMQLFPAAEDVVRRLAVPNLFELAFQVFSCSHAAVRTFDTGFLICALPIDPVTEVCVD